MCFEHGQGDGYQLGTGTEYSLIDVAKAFSDNYVITLPEKGERLHGKADLTKIRGLGWNPRHSLLAYIKEFKASVDAGR
ncbi:MAG TPA: hypothetical protein VD886_16200 [Herpetosiphonaceae bacterium]|nr:hypothetical protein [Herpetosiphonaceae bacterium]